MRVKNLARLPLAAVCGLAALAVAAPAAQAQYPDPLYPSTNDQPCERAAGLVKGVGASFQRTAHLNWGITIGAPDPASPLAKGFGYDAGGCNAFKLPADGGTKKITYSPAGSGAGRAPFGATNTPGAARDTTIDFGGTDEAPTQTQIDNANEGPNVIAGPDSDDGILHTIPIAQGVDAADVRVPDGCQIANSSARQLSAIKLEGFWRGLVAYDSWGELFGFSNVKASAGSGLTDQQCQAKKPKHVVRFDNGGTTFIFKRYLQQAGAGAFDWREPSEGGTLANNAWPTATINAGINGNGPLLDTLSAQGVDGGLGYSDLGAARGRGYGWDYSAGVPVATDRTFWIRTQRIADGVYVSPARSDDQVGAKGARCTGATYANQPADTTSSWFSVTAVLTAADNPMCALTYALAWESPLSMGIGSLSRSTARRDYIGYTLDRPGLGTTPATQQCVPTDPRYGKGQCKLPLNDYARLPADVFTTSQAGAIQLGP